MTNNRIIAIIPGRRVCASAMLVCVFMLPVPTMAQIGVAEGTPAGFEALEKPRPVSVSLYYGGDAIGNTMAHVSPGHLQFDDPNAIMDMVPTISDRARVGAVLGQSLPTNEASACTVKKKDDCGNIEPEVAGVIYDDRNMAAELFISKNLLKISADNGPRYLPLPKRSLASIYAFGGAISGSQGEAPDFSLTSDAVHSLGEMKLTSQSTVSNGGLRFDTAAASVDRNGWNATGGLFRSAPMQLLSDRDMLGVSYSTSMKTRLDGKKTEGNKIIVYLPRRSFVSLYREGRLYSSAAYEAGNQEIDTSELPDGAYDITLHIEESDGTVREEKRFFAKTEEIPAAGKPQWYVQAGLIRDPAQIDDTVPKISADPIVRAGLKRRISDNIGAGVAVLGTKDRAAVEGTGFLMIPDGQFQLTGLASSKGDTGVEVDYGQTHKRFNVSVNARKTWMSDTPMAGFEDLSHDITQASATVSYAVSEKMTLGARASFSKDSGHPATTSLGPYAEWRVWQQGEDMLTASANAARTENRDDASVLVSYTHHIGKFGVSTTGGMAAGGKNGGPLGNARVWHDNQTPGNDLILAGGVSGDNRSRTVDAAADWKNHIGQFRGNVQDAFGSDGNGVTYGGNFTVNALNKGGEIHIGGDDPDKSAVIVDTRGDVSDDMTIFVNDIEHSDVKVGNKRVLYLSPFHSYNIRLVPKKPGLLDYESGNRRITLYPGNVVKEAWDVNKFYVVVATIVRANGTPLADAAVQETKEQTATDENGHLQAELSKPQHMTLDNGKGICTVTLPPVQDVNGVLLYEQPLVCR